MTRRGAIVQGARWRATAALLAAALLLLLAAGQAAGAVTGVLVERHGDRLDGTSTPPEYLVSTPARDVRLSAPQDPALVGRLVAVTDRDAARPGVQGTAVRAAHAQAPSAAWAQRLARPQAGPRPTLVILVAMADAAQPFTEAEARDVVFTGPTSASLLYVQQSRTASWLTGVKRTDGDVVGPIATGVASVGCPTGDVAKAADAGAAQLGYAADAYAHVIYVMPHVDDCDWAGLGNMPGSRSWANGDLSTRVIAHELGHNRGAHHAGSLTCTGPSGDPAALGDACTRIEYGDPFDAMGGYDPHLMSTFHRAQIGDLPLDGVVVATHAGSYPLARSEDAAGTRLVLVPRKLPGQPVSDFYALERRAVLGPFDAFEPDDPIVGGVSVRLVPRLDASVQTSLLDMHPATSWLGDAALQPSESFADPQRPIALTVAPAGDAVSIAMPPFVDDVPPTFDWTPWLATDTEEATIEWLDATDDVAVDHYEIERDGAIVGSTRATDYVDHPRGRHEVRYRVIAVDTSGNRGASEAVSEYVPGRASRVRPVARIRRIAHRRHRARTGWVWTERFAAANATRMLVRIDGRAVRFRRASRIAVSVRVPFDAQRRRTVRVVARNSVSRRSTTWTYGR